MENIENPPEQIANIPPHPPTLMQELALIIQRMPAWLFALLTLSGIFLLYQIASGIIAVVILGIKLQITEDNKTSFRLIQMLGQFLFILAPTIVLARLRFPNLKNVFRFNGFRPLELAVVLVASFALQQLLIGYMLVQQALPFELPPIFQEWTEMAKDLIEKLTTANSIPEFILVVLVVGLTPAICEELLFRGLIQRSIGDFRGSPVGLRAALVSGIIFGVYHLSVTQVVPLAALGMYFGFVVYRTQNIVSSMVAHFVNNFLACLAVFLRLDDEFLAVSPTAEPTAALLAANFVLCAVVFVAATAYFIHITKRAEQASEQLSAPV